jgi:signal transduction histidine kinase/ligand-binding sensor domain-containing protein
MSFILWRSIRIFPSAILTAFLGVLFLAPSTRAYGKTADVPLVDWYHSRWTVKEAVPSEINALAQTSDGYLWLGTRGGLYRFDGVAFERYKPPAGARVPATIITALSATEDGGLWIGYYGPGMITGFLKNGVITAYTRTDHSPPTTVYAFSRRENTIWAATNYGLLRFDGHYWQDVGQHYNYPDSHPDNILVDSRETVWASTRKGLVFRKKGEKDFVIADREVSNKADIVQAPNGAVWMASTNGWVRQVTSADGTLKRKYPFLKVKAEGMTFSRDGTMWVTTEGEGLIRIAAPEQLPDGVTQKVTPLQRFSQVNGLTSDFAIDFGSAVMEDREGSIWLTTSKGLDQFRKSALAPIQLAKGATYISIVSDPAGGVMVGTETFMHTLAGVVTKVITPPGRVECAYRDPHNEIWLGGPNGLWRLSQDRFISYPLPKGLNPSGHNVQSITMDQAGSLWVSFDRSGVYRLTNGEWSVSGNLHGLLPVPPLNEITDTMGRLWFTYTENRVAMIKGNIVSSWGPQDGLDIGNVITVYEHKGQIWVGGEDGLEFLAGNRFHRVSFDGNNVVEGISGIVVTVDGDMWLNQGSGVVYIRSSEITSALNNPQYRVRYELLDYLDGIVSAPEQIRPLPSAIAADDGRIYFATRSSVTWIDPAHISRNTIEPSVNINSVIADGRDYTDLAGIKLAPNTDNLEIRFTTSSLLIPQRVRFRYMMERLDNDWKDPGTQRRAFYSRVPPGAYKFKVIACNNDGLCSRQAASISITIPPSFVQSIQFKLLCAITAAGLLWLFYQVRIRQVSAQVRSRLHERHAERERIAQDLHDTFFQGIQGLILRFNTGTSMLRKDEPARVILEEALKQSDQVMLEGRELVLDLRTGVAESRDLATALAAVGAEFEGIHTIEFKVLVHGEPLSLDPIVFEEAYKLGREAICNAFHHSNAHFIEGEITYDSHQLRICIRDDGDGIDPQVLHEGHRIGHLGLPGMRQRAKKLGAHLRIWSRPNAGTEIELSIPSTVAYRSVKTSSWSRWLRTIIEEQER